MGRRSVGQALVVAPKTLTVSGGAVTPNCNESNQFDIDTNASFTINAPTNPAHGDAIVFAIKNTHATNAITITFDAVFRFGSGLLLSDVQTLLALKVYYITCRYRLADTKWDVMGFSPAH